MTSDNKRFPSHLHHSHHPDKIKERLNSNQTHSYLRDFVYGGIDGTVTTFAVVSGVIGANLESKTILILGMANLIADGFSMAASNYLGTRTEIEEHALIKEFEYEQIKNNPHGEKEEVRQILASKGFQGDLLTKSVELYIKDKDRWVEFMLKEEYGLSSATRSAIKAGIVTFIAFSIFGLIPLLPYLGVVKPSFTLSCTLTGIAFFLIGSMKSNWTTETKLSSGLKTFAIGAIAAALAYFVGTLFK